MYPGKVLLIDDDTRNTFALKAVLQAKKYQCIVANAALDGIRLLNEQNDIRVVLLDMMMPEMDGYETLGIIRLGRHKDIPVIAVTAQAMVGDREKCLEAGANGYISKPIDIDQLIPLLERYVA